MISISSLPVYVVALAQALGLWVLHDALRNGSWPANDPGPLMAAYLVILVVPLTLVLSWRHHRRRLLWGVTMLLGGFLVWTAVQRFGALAPDGGGVLDEDVIAQNLVPFALAVLLFLPMLRARLESGRWIAPYVALFQAAWRTALTLAESLVFTGAFWALLSLWAELFNLLGIGFFRDLFADSRFVYPATTLAFATAIQIIDDSERLLDGVLEQVLELLKWLAPLAGIIVVVFTLFLVPRWIDLFDSGERVINSSILLALVAANVLLLNAAYRDGASDPRYGRLLRECLRVVPPLLVIVAVTAVASLVIRVQALGLTHARLWGLVTAAFALLHAVGYSWAAMTRTPWFGPLSRVNFALATALLGTLLLSLTPFGDPLRWSIAAQQRRAVLAESTQVRESALRYLRFDAGEPGRRALLALQEDPRVGTAAVRIVALAHDDRPRDNDPQATLARYERWRGTLVATDVPVSLEGVLRMEFMRFATTLDPGGGAPPPELLRIDLDGNGMDDYLLIAGALRGNGLRDRDYRLFVSEEDGAGWTLGSSGTIRGFAEQDGSRTRSPIPARAVPPRWLDLERGGQRLSLRPQSSPDL